MNNYNFKYISTDQRRDLLIGVLFLFLSVALGAFAAHGLKKIITPASILTFKTGVRYMVIHGFGLIFIGILKSHLTYPKFLILPARLMILGTVIFSGLCFAYALTGIKTFAMIIPTGGVFFLLAWVTLFLQLNKKV